MSLVAIFDADKEGFLRSPRSLIQTIGRAARNVNGRVIMYADHVTAGDEARDGRDRAAARAAGDQYNEEHGIIPTTIVRAIMNINPAAGPSTTSTSPSSPRADGAPTRTDDVDMQERMAAMRLEMFAAAENLEFEKAARLRDELKKLEGWPAWRQAPGPTAPRSIPTPPAARGAQTGRVAKARPRPPLPRTGAGTRPDKARGVWRSAS